MAKSKMKRCSVCGTEFKEYVSQPRKTCSKKCMGISNKGAGNPNFGNKWNDTQRKQLSDDCILRSTAISSRVKADWTDNEARRKHASEIMAACRPGEGVWQGRRHKEDSKTLIGTESSAKWTDEYKINHRKTMEELGHFVRLEDLSDYEVYVRIADWQEKMWDRCSCSEKTLLKEHGIFNTTSNRKGVVRDHKYGRRAGFDNDVFPELLRHPVNCELLLISDNTKKRFHNNDTSISLDQLFNDIKNYTGVWAEQKFCLSLINKYAKGVRYIRRDNK